MMWIGDNAANTPTLMDAVAVPEPATLAFFGILGGGLLAVRRLFKI